MLQIENITKRFGGLIAVSSPVPAPHQLRVGALLAAFTLVSSAALSGREERANRENHETLRNDSVRSVFI